MILSSLYKEVYLDYPFLFNGGLIPFLEETFGVKMSLFLVKMTTSTEGRK